MILLDNSEYMRNGDYIPTRLEAQSDAANLLVNAKTGSNPESTVGVIAMSSHGPSSGAELLVSPTDDIGKILSALHGVRLSGEMSPPPGRDAVDIAASVQVAALALKHRRNKNGSQRIVLFVGSPLTAANARDLVKAGKQLKKNNVAIDVVVLGETEVNEPKLRELVDAANGTVSASDGEDGGGERTCHLVTIPAGVLPSDVLVASPILRGDGGGGMGGVDMGGSGGGGGGGFADFGGVDPNMDPELAMALRVSMEEERARQERSRPPLLAVKRRSQVRRVLRPLGWKRFLKTTRNPCYSRPLQCQWQRIRCQRTSRWRWTLVSEATRRRTMKMQPCKWPWQCQCRVRRG